MLIKCQCRFIFLTIFKNNYNKKKIIYIYSDIFVVHCIFFFLMIKCFFMEDQIITLLTDNTMLRSWKYISSEKQKFKGLQGSNYLNSNAFGYEQKK